MSLWLALLLAASSSSAPAAELGALHKLSSAVAAEASHNNAEAPVALHVRSDSPELSAAFATLLCAQLARQRLPCLALEKVPAADAETAARLKGARSLLRISLTVEHGLMHARGDLLGTWVNFWSGSTPSRPASPAAAFERSVDADAFAITLLSAPLQSAPMQTTTAERLELTAFPFARIGNWTAAVAAGDLDGDRKAEIVALTDDELLVYSAEGRLLARRELKALPLSVTPSREPYGFVSVLPAPPRIRYSSSRHARGETLTLEGGALRPAPATGDVTLLHAGRTIVSAQPQAGTNTALVAVTFSAEAPSVGGPFTSVSAFALPTAGAYVLAVNPDGGAVIFTAPAQQLVLTGLATASALVDLDGDGIPELVSTANEYRPAEDELRVFPLPQASNTEPLIPTTRVPIPRGRVIQVVGADVDADGAQEVIAASWLSDGTTELLLFRRRTP